MPTGVKPFYSYLFAAIALFTGMSTASRAAATPKPVIAYKGPLFRLFLHDPQKSLGERLPIFISNMKAAVEEWNRVIPFKAALDIEVRLIKAGEGRLDAASRTTKLLRKTKDREIYEESAAYKVRTGKSASPGETDILVRINPQYLNDEVWLDPHPETKTSSVPKSKVDLVSLLKHELGHALGFHSFRNLKTGHLPADYMSAFDALTELKGQRFFFVGQQAKKEFGGPVPLTSTIESQNHSHYGNAGDTQLVVSGLMSGVTIHYGRRYEIGALDRAILKDLGLIKAN